MRAIVIDDIDTVAVREVPVPRPGPNEVLVRVQASSVNGFDLAVISGGLKDLVEYNFPVTLGKDFAGAIESVGEVVTAFGPGDEVFGFVPGMALGGAFAEFAVVPADVALAPRPAGLDVASAGSLALAGSAALVAVDAIAPSPGARRSAPTSVPGRNGEVRTDLELDELVDFLVVQTYLAAEDVDRSEDAVRKRFRHFVVPAIEARDSSGGALISRTREVDNAISAAVEALQNLAGQLNRSRGTAS